MNQGLWEWQDEDAARLHREGKEQLARCWEVFDLDGAALKDAADIARAEGEPVWEMFYLHWYVQQGLFRENANLQRVQPAVERLAHLAGTPHCGDCPQRFCARESVANFQMAADPPGFADEVLDASRAMAGQVPTELECRACFDLLEAGSLLELRRLDDALGVLDRIEADQKDDNTSMLALLYRAAVGHERGDLEAMAVLLEQAADLIASGADVNTDNCWFLLELEVRRAIADRDLDRAEALYQESPMAPPPLSAEAMRISLGLAEAHALGGGWKASREHARAALDSAKVRGMVRYAAEAALWAAEACQQMGDLEALQGYATDLEMLLPQLRSRDLDQRARQLRASP